jgi:lipopolysaccharide biosynthesis glycosyltransferase
MEDKLTIVYACDNNFAPLLAASIKSLELNSSGSHKDIFIIDDKISSVNIEKIKQSVASNEVALHFVPAKTIIPKEYSIPYFNNSALPITTFFRLFIENFIPKSTKKVLYLDSDMIVLENVKKLFDTNIDNYILAAVQDPGIKTFGCEWGGGVRNHEELGYPADTKYFNAGLLLINLPKWIESGACRTALEYAVKYNKHIVYGDQYCLNAALGNKWLELDSSWNHLADTFIPNPNLIHYIGHKPIYTNYANQDAYRKIFFDYLNQTAWQNIKLVGRRRRGVAMIKRFIGKLIN